MKDEIYFAPMEGITGRIFRKVFHKHFKGVSEYYTPFLTPKEKRGIDKKDIRELTEDREDGMKLIPQLLCSDAESFQNAAEKIIELGFHEINLNLGCPSGTVVNKAKGAGALRDLTKLDHLLSGIFSFSEKKGFRVSIKSRIGYHSFEEFPAILNVFQKYPIEKLILHPRTRMDFYKGRPHKESFRLAMEVFDKKETFLCFNGDLNTKKDLEEIKEEFFTLSSFMIGRGFLRNPFFIEEITEQANSEQNKKKRLKSFLDELFFSYAEDIGSERVAMLKLKEIWSYLHHLFNAEEACFKEIRKASDVSVYRAAANVIFSNIDLREE